VSSQVKYSYLERVPNQKSHCIGVFHLTSHGFFLMELPSGINRLSYKMFHEVQIERG